MALGIVGELMSADFVRHRGRWRQGRRRPRGQVPRRARPRAWAAWASSSPRTTCSSTSGSRSSSCSRRRSRNAEAVARFAREARAAVKIKSEHVARVIDVGTLENGAPYMVMEYLEGGDLADWLERARPAARRAGRRLRAPGVRGDRRGARARHRAPRSQAGEPLLHPPRRRRALHQGARLRHLEDDRRAGTRRRHEHDARPQAVMGSPLYMSPEQMQSSQGRRRAPDIWALGRHPLRAPHGPLPFEGETMTELVAEDRHGAAPAPHRDGARDHACARSDHPALPRKEPGPPVFQRCRARVRSAPARAARREALGRAHRQHHGRGGSADAEELSLVAARRACHPADGRQSALDHRGRSGGHAAAGPDAADDRRGVGGRPGVRPRRARPPCWPWCSVAPRCSCSSPGASC